MHFVQNGDALLQVYDLLIFKLVQNLKQFSTQDKIAFRVDFGHFCQVLYP